MATTQTPLSTTPASGNRLRMIRIPALAVLMTGLASAIAGDPQPAADKVKSSKDFKGIQSEVETLRGKKFKREVPVYQISAKELRGISDRALEKQYPGSKLRAYEELLTWLDVVPPNTD